MSPTTVTIENAKPSFFWELCWFVVRCVTHPLGLVITSYITVSCVHQAYDLFLLLGIYSDDWQYWARKKTGENRDFLLVSAIALIGWVIVRSSSARVRKLSLDPPLVYTREKVTPFLEKMRPGSPLIHLPAPSFQFTISTTSGEHLGGGFNSGNVLYTAWHVVEGQSSVYVTGPSMKAEISLSRFVRREGDIAMCAVTDKEVCMLGLTSAKLHPYSLSSTTGVFAQISGYNSGSIGFVESHRTFGFVSYDGSTVNGYSGCPYYVGKTVYGMHVGGSSQNVGYEAAYLHLISRKGLESSEDYLMDLVTKRKSFKYERSPYDPDEFRVVVGDKYFMVDSETLENLQVRAKAHSTPRVTYEAESSLLEPTFEAEPQTTPLREDVLEEVFREGAVGASKDGPLQAPPVVPPQSGTPNEPQVLKFQPDIEASTSGRKLMAAQRREACDATSKFIKMLRTECNAHRVKLLKKRADFASHSSEYGRIQELRNVLANILAESLNTPLQS